ncbi:MAG TPA: cytochrome C [Fibrobacteres bacterium]|nr:cytochrome C [Fibrobacterota bacterium]
MNKWLKRTMIVLAAVAGFVILASVAATLYALVGYRKTWDVPLPATRASTDSSAIARGRYIVYGPGRCADCHSPDSTRPQLFLGQEVPLIGGPGEHTYLGTWSAPNLTPDSATGIGAVSDGQLARMMRHGVNREGRIGLPFMDAFADLTEEDLIAVLSFLRSLPPQPGVPPKPQLNLLGKITLSYFIQPYAPRTTLREKLTPEPSVRYGEYLANTLGGCGACHTARSLKTGEYLSPFFSGGLAFHSHLHPDTVYVSPNLTPDSATGRITAWSEQDFMQRFRAGLLIPDAPMPWGGFSRMTDDDLRALYRYLRSLAPVHHETGPTIQHVHGQAAG